MRNILHHKPQGVPLEFGEIALDVDGRRLELTTFLGRQSLPLDFVALEVPDGNAGNLIYVYQDDGVARIAPYRGGGGGQADHGYAWSVPGLTPTAVATRVISGSYVADFEVQEPLTIQALRLRAQAGAGSVSIEILRADGSTIDSWLDQVTTSPGTVTRVISISLDPGRYSVRLFTNAAITFQVIEGRLPWTAQTQAHPVMMEIG